MKSNQELLDLGFAFVNEERCWPRVTDIPSSTAVRRAFGSFSNYKHELIKAYTEKYGTPEWDVTGPAPKRTKTTLAREAVADTLQDSISRIGAFPPTKPPKKRTGKLDVAEMHLAISDVHVGSFVDASLASNLSKGYNIDVFRNCADTMEERVIFFKELYDSGFKCEKLVVGLLGDVVDGEAIFLGQALQVDRIITEQVVEAAHRFASMFYNWSKIFREVEVFCVPGNHGRIGKKNELHWRSNLDYMAYLFIQQKLEAQKNVNVFISRSPNMIVRHGITNFLYHHGDFVKGGAGSYVAYERKVQSISAMGDIPIHFSVSGHYHHSSSNSGPNARQYFTNGSWPGTNEFSVNVINTGDTPAQKMWLFAPERGLVHSQTDIYLGERVSLEEDENGIFTSYE